jgi:hypothetical protein
MLHFFRKIRRDLLANSQFFKYLKYAIGEIVLVVLGILIALYINTENEKKKELHKFNQDLMNVELELESNINVSKFYINTLARADSAYLKLFIDSVEIRDYYFYNDILTRWRPHWVAREESYEKLDRNFKYGDKRDSILGHLKWLYKAEGLRVKHTELQLLNNINENSQKFESYDWYISWRFNNMLDSNIIDFFKNDPDYRKLAAKNFAMFFDYLEAAQNYHILANSVCKSILQYLDTYNLRYSDSLLFGFNPKEFKHYVGKYEAKWCSERDYIFDDSCVVSIENEKMFWTGYRSDGPDTRVEITPINKYRFFDERGGGVYHLEIDAQEEVTGIIFSTGPSWIYVLEKTR